MLSATCSRDQLNKIIAYLAVERVDLARDELVGLLGVWVGKEVVLDLLGLSGHLGVSVDVSREVNEVES